MQDTRPADLDNLVGGHSAADFRIAQPQEQLQLLRALRDGAVPVIMNGPDGSAYTTTLWAIDEAQQRISFDADAGSPVLRRIVDQNEAVAVAHLHNIKVQFDLHDLVVVQGRQASSVQCAWPDAIFRLQRRNSFRVPAVGRLGPVARLTMPPPLEAPMALRVIDLSIGGCALWLPREVPAPAAGVALGEVRIDLDTDTHLVANARLQHVSRRHDDAGADAGSRLGCEWRQLSGTAERVLQRWIDLAQRRLRMLAGR